MYHRVCQNLDERLSKISGFWDISKALNRVWHNGLMKKLKLYGIAGNLLKWFKNYLSDRRKFVFVNIDNNLHTIYLYELFCSITQRVQFFFFFYINSDNVRVYNVKRPRITAILFTVNLTRLLPWKRFHSKSFYVFREYCLSSNVFMIFF